MKKPQDDTDRTMKGDTVTLGLDEYQTLVKATANQVLKPTNSSSSLAPAEWGAAATRIGFACGVLEGLELQTLPGLQRDAIREALHGLRMITALPAMLATRPVANNNQPPAWLPSDLIPVRREELEKVMQCVEDACVSTNAEALAILDAAMKRGGG